MDRTRGRRPFAKVFSSVLSPTRALFQHLSRRENRFLVLAPRWLLLIGILTGLVTRTIVGGEAYGSTADALLGITGAFFVSWILERLTHNTISWSNSTLFTIWGAAALPLLAHFCARHQTARPLSTSFDTRWFVFEKKSSKTDR